MDYAEQTNLQVFSVAQNYQIARNGTKSVLFSWKYQSEHDSWFWGMRPKPGDLLLMNVSQDNFGYGYHRGGQVLYIRRENIHSIVPASQMNKWVKWHTPYSLLRARRRVLLWLALVVYWLLLSLQKGYSWVGYLVWKALYIPRPSSSEQPLEETDQPPALEDSDPSKPLDVELLPGIGDIPVGELSNEQLREILRQRERSSSVELDPDDREDEGFGELADRHSPFLRHNDDEHEPSVTVRPLSISQMQEVFHMYENADKKDEK
ncbi:hypothetical protein E4U03_00540 [Rothia nasimurium]|uniref:Uncharacterized protein n=1 Tax=Rothia nasimurium TaxID=85336 RepID=A0A4Y9F8P3_9MICC|nr:hypothetical protein [Rothia nasimurium]MBF0807112.1 hypothetical protein [Rothia nasimurium]TFU24430.1 hypothetical protein E4U03_00540 [Rothia nasimurium]